MHFGLIISLGLHTALLGWAVLNIQMLAPLRVAEPEPIAVDLVTPGEITKLRLGLRTAKQLQAQPKESPRPDVAKKEAAKPTPVAAAPPPPAPEPAAAKERAAQARAAQARAAQAGAAQGRAAAQAGAATQVRTAERSWR